MQTNAVEVVTNVVASTVQADPTGVADLLTQLSPAAITLFVLIGIGRGLKTWELFPDKYIPLALMTLGGLFWSLENIHAYTFVVTMQGFGMGLVAVGAHQLMKQAASPPA